MIADTNILIRAVLDDDVIQGSEARRIMSSADQIFISRHALCELVWLLRQRYKRPKAEVVRVIRRFLEADNVITDTVAVQSGLDAMEAGADFADGVIAYEGRWMGGETFASFDKKAVQSQTKLGYPAKWLG